ncbi:hypothetical protein [Cryobacterium sp. TMS1-13-1]|uniref:hypothetical protein n=1 Tax=Cryobacterium sp. TMS1-13-1 TaxID=1259220 RepID=UPI00106BDF0E|nr:hypothetical protein [Cryobacterium sp. TMS1-13-1]TFD23389.1 hypothetical protein E3T31_05410 [Cryobacterium sp. TMS1-13-1]
MSTAIFIPGPANATRLGKSFTRVVVLAAVALLAVFGLTFAPSGSSASAAQTITQCNNVANTGGLGLNCDVIVVNNLDVSTGVASSTVTVKECHAAANTAPTCTTATTSYDSLTTSVNQCNDAANGGGSSVVCNVMVTNNVTGSTSTDVTDATVNQCNGSGAEGTGPTLNCDPFPASTTGATITQCNGSTNGGGASDRVTCTVTPSTTSALLPVSINQCNGTANGGGSVVTCAASLTNITLASATTPTPIAKNTLHDSKTDGFVPATDDGGSPLLLGVGALLLAALVAAAIGARRISARH